MSVLVDPEEIKKLMAPKPEGIVTLREAERRLRTSTKVVTALIDQGHLDARTILNPVTRREQTVIDCAELARFETEFVSLQSLAKERNLHFRRVAADLRAKGVTPVDDPALLKVTLYRRSEIA